MQRHFNQKLTPIHFSLDMARIVIFLSLKLAKTYLIVTAK